MNVRDGFIGVDVSKDRLDVAVRPTGEGMSFANTEDSIGAMRDFIQSFLRVLSFWKLRADGRRLSSALWRRWVYPWWS